MQIPPRKLKDNEPVAIGVLGASYLQGESTRALGRPVANFNILLHLLASKEVSEIYVFLQFGEQATAFMKLFDGYAIAAKFVFVSVDSLPQTTAKLQGFLCGDLYTHFANVIGLAPDNMPVFTFTHSLDCDIGVTQAAFFKMHMAKARIYDTILATSVGASQFLSNIQESCQLKHRPSVKLDGLPIDLRYLKESTLVDHRKMFANDDHWSFLYVGRVDFDTKADLRSLLYSSIFENKTNTLTILGNFNSEAKEFFDKNHRAVELRARNQLYVIESNGNVVLNRQYYETSHFLVSPANSYQETFGLTVAEAKSQGCLPIVTGVQGYIDQVSEVDRNLIVPLKVQAPPLSWEQTMAMADRREVNRFRSRSHTFDVADLNAAIEHGKKMWLESSEKIKEMASVERERQENWGDRIASLIRITHQRATGTAQSNTSHNANPLHSTMSGFNDF